MKELLPTYHRPTLRFSLSLILLLLCACDMHPHSILPSAEALTREEPEQEIREENLSLLLKQVKVQSSGGVTHQELEAFLARMESLLPPSETRVPLQEVKVLHKNTIRYGIFAQDRFVGEIRLVPYDIHTAMILFREGHVVTKMTVLYQAITPSELAQRFALQKNESAITPLECAAISPHPIKQSCLLPEWRHIIPIGQMSDENHMVIEVRHKDKLTGVGVLDSTRLPRMTISLDESLPSLETQCTLWILENFCSQHMPPRTPHPMELTPFSTGALLDRPPMLHILLLE